MRFRILTLLAIIGFTSCVEPIDLPPDEVEENQLVVEGYITTEAGPYWIKLSSSATYGSVFDGITERVRDAEVAIRTDDGRTIRLFHVGQGLYETPSDFIGEVGRTYSLIVVWDGDQYISTPQTIVEVPDIDEVTLEYRKLEGIDEFSFTSGVEIYSTFTDEPDTENYLMWTKTDGVYPFTAAPTGCTVPSNNCCPPIDFAANCFRYERNFNQVAYNYGPVPSCLKKEVPTFKYGIASDEFRDGNQITQRALFIEDDGRRFEYKYRFMLNQLSLSKEAFAFYTLLQSQQSISGDLFDPPPADIKGNMINQTTPSRLALGYFGAYDLKKMEVYIPRSILQETRTKAVFARDCWILDSATTNRPPWWDGPGFVPE